MKLVCPKCQKELPAEGVNVGADVAYCAGCREGYKISELVEGGQADEPGDIGEPPRGAWFRTDIDGWEVGATTRSAAAFFLVPFMCVWSGFSLGGIYGSQIMKGEFSLTMSLFGIPFVLGTLLFGSIAVMTVCGKVCVRVRGDEAETFMGVGGIGLRRRFVWSEVKKIMEGEPTNRNPGQQSVGIKIDDGKRPIQIGAGIREDRRMFMLRVLRRMRFAPMGNMYQETMRGS